MRKQILPKYITLTADGATITLTKPATLNGIERDTITLRAPTVREMRAAQQNGNSDEDREINLFATLAEVGVKDLDGLMYKDYNRISTAYNFLVLEDGL